MLAPNLSTVGSPPVDTRALLPDAPESDFTIEVVRDAADLESRIGPWRRLVESAIEPNVFFEPSLLLPALKHLAGNDRPEFVLLYARSKTNHDGDPVLCGMFPLQRWGRVRGRKIPGVSTWMHLHCFCGTPLVRADIAAPVLHAFFDWLAGQGRGRTMYFPLVHAGGLFAQQLAVVLQQRGSLWFIQQQFARSQFGPAASTEEYMQQVWSRKSRHETRRQHRRLGELGETQFRELSPQEDVGPWLQAFLDLEASGWKGQNGTAFASVERERNYFLEALSAAHDQGQLQMLSLELNGNPIAMNTAFYTADGGYYFKIAFDESLAKYSPGVVLESEFVRVLHDRTGLTWLDSCADANHPMIERLWDQRRLIQSIWISSGGIAADLCLTTLSALHSFKKCGSACIKPLFRKGKKRK